MKSKILLILLFIAGAISNLFANTGDTITLNLNRSLTPDHFEFPAGGGSFTNTDDADDNRMFEVEHFSFSYFDTYEFTVSNRGDNTDHGSLNAGSNSTGWLGNYMFGTMAGGGIKTDEYGNVLKDQNGKVLVEDGIPFIGAYYSEYMGAMPLKVVITDAEAPYRAVGMYVNNNPWPYYSNIYGDGVARALDKEGDFFRVTIHGLDENYRDNGKSVVYNLAEYENGTFTQNIDWEWVDLSSLGEVYGFFFTVEGSDTGAWGLNTAAYFNMDKLQVSKLQSGLPSINGSNVAVYPNPFTDYIVIEAASHGNATVYDLSGKPALTVNLKPGSNQIVTSALPKGVYVLNFSGNTIKIVK